MPISVQRNSPAINTKLGVRYEKVHRAMLGDSIGILDSSHLVLVVSLTQMLGEK